MEVLVTDAERTDSGVTEHEGAEEIAAHFATADDLRKDAAAIPAMRFIFRRGTGINECYDIEAESDEHEMSQE